MRYCSITASLLHWQFNINYYIITTQLLRYYYIITTSLLQYYVHNHYYPHYYFITTSLLHHYCIITQHVHYCMESYYCFVNTVTTYFHFFPSPYYHYYHFFPPPTWKCTDLLCIPHCNPPPHTRVEGGPAPSRIGLLLGPPRGAWSIEVL